MRITTLHPFAREGNGKWQVAAAIRDREADAWSAEYFQRLTAFVRAADQREHRGPALPLHLPRLPATPTSPSSDIGRPVVLERRQRRRPLLGGQQPPADLGRHRPVDHQPGLHATSATTG